MRIPWVIVGGTGYDVEEVPNPQTRDMQCPACGKHVRFVEKELVKNLRVFGVPLVGVEKGRRVFECPHCRVCVEPPAEEPASTGAATTGALDALEAQLTRAQDEAWLWGQRVDLAERNGDADLAREALRLRVAAEGEVSRLQGELTRARGAARPAEKPAAAKPAIVARAGADGIAPSVDDEFAALKARVAARGTTSEAAAASEPVQEETAESDVADAFAALKTRLASRAVEDEGGPAKGEEPEGRDADALARVPGQPVAHGDETLDADVVALKQRLGGDGKGRDGDAYEALKRELREPAAETPPAVPTPPAAPPPDDDPVDALKRKLRKR